VGMEEQRQRPIRRLSKGQRRRVEFAQALVPRADLLLMDEPFEGVDPVWCEALRQVLRARAASGATVILSSHQLADVEQTCDALTVLEDGQIVAGGSMDEVLGLKDQWALRLIPPPQHPVSEEQIRQALAPLEAEVDVTRPRQDLLSLLRRRGKPT